MKCKNCGKEIRKDDVDYNFKGCYDTYWICDGCNIGCNEIVRYSKTINEIWSEEE